MNGPEVPAVDSQCLHIREADITISSPAYSLWGKREYELFTVHTCQNEMTVAGVERNDNGEYWNAS